MARMLTSSSEFHGFMPSSVGSINMEAEAEKLMEEETTSTVDSSTLHQQQLFASECSPYSGGIAHGSSSMRPVSKGKAMKKMKNEEEDEEIDIDKCAMEDHSRVSVKILRKIIPKLRIVCYYSDEQVSGKRKLKHLWDEKPSDWPSDVPFKDPNNAIKDTKKPGKDELAPMYEFLRKKYLEKKSFNEASNGLQGYSSSVGNSGANLGMDHQDSMYRIYQTMNHAQPSDDSAGISYITATSAGYGAIGVAPSTLEDSKDTKLWNLQSWPPVLEHNHSSYPSEELRSGGMLAPTRTEHPTRGMHQLMNTVTIPETITSTWDSQVRASGHVSNNVSLPKPVKDLYGRLKEKQREVEIISGHNSEVKLLLASVQKDVTDCIYEKLTAEDTRLCLMFLDAGHQYEALLDVMLVLGNNPESGGLLSGGCQEIINKFKKECITLMSFIDVLRPQFGSSTSVRSAAYGVHLVDSLQYSNSLLFPPTEDDKAKQIEELSASLLGIRGRSQNVQDPSLNSMLEIRSDPFISTDDQKQLDDKREQEVEDIFKDYWFGPSTSETQTVSLVETDAYTPIPVQTCSSPPTNTESVVARPIYQSEPFNGEQSVGMELDLEILAEVIGENSTDMSAGEFGSYAFEPYSSVSSWESGATGTSSLGSAPLERSGWNAGGNSGQYQSLYAGHCLPQSTPASHSQINFTPDFTYGAEGVARQSVSPAIPLSVVEASADDFDVVSDQQRVGRRRPRQSRVSTSSRGINQSYGRT